MPASLICGLHNGAEIQKEGLNKNTQNLASQGKAEACGKEDKVMSPSPGFVEKADNWFH